MTINNNNAGTGISRRALLRILLLLAVVVGGWLIFYFTPVADWFNETHLRDITEQVRALWWTPLVLMAIYVIFALTGVPSAPLFVAGAVFGPWWGTAYNTLGLTLGAIAGYTLAKQLGQEFVLQAAGARYYRVQRFIHRFGFWPLVQARFLPIPDTMLNFSAALAGVPWNLYLLASLVGLLPSTLIHTFCISELIYADNNSDRALIGAVYLGSFVVLNLAVGGPWLLSQWRRRAKYQKIVAQRKQPRPIEQTTLKNTP